MGVILFLILLIGFFIWIAVKDAEYSGRNTTKAQTSCATLRCPTCGAQARVNGDWWECGWCGDSGRCVRK